MTLRTFILAASLLLLAGPAVAQTADRDQTADQQVVQVLNRLTFGPRPGDARAVRQIGVDAWIDRQLHPERIDDRANEQRLDAWYPVSHEDQNALAMQYADFARARAMRRQAKRDTTTALSAEDSMAFRQLAQQRRELVGALVSARVARAVGSERQLQEVMTDFWENHFTVFVGKGAPEAYYLVDYDRTTRAHALGKFRDLLGAVAHSPAMLFYLDNAQSRANPDAPTLAPARTPRFQRFQRFPIFRRPPPPPPQQPKRTAGLNENYGRELLELHTLGVDGGYTQQDVINVARALTGWSIRPPGQGGGFIFRPEWHDAGTKVILGHTFPSGRGEEEGEEVLDLLSRSPATAHFIALKLARRFVSDTPSEALVQRAAHTFLRTDGDIREVLRTIITSPEFFSQRAYHAKVKSPFEVVVRAARALGATPDSTPRTAGAIALLGQPVFGHQAPNGWPETGDAWMNTGAILNRINFGMAVAAGRLPGASLRNVPGADSLLRAPREQQVDAVVQTILGGAVSPEMRKILMTGEHPFAADAARTAGQVGDQDRSPPQLNGFAQVVGLALGSPEFQRR